MANVANITKILDGEKSAVFHVFIRGDGLSGDFSKLTLIDPAVDLTPPPGKKPSLTITELWYSFTGFDARLEFDYLNDETGVWTCTAGNATQICFDEFGGIKDRSNELDGTGKLMITTTNLLSVSCCATLIIKVRKN